MKRIPLCIHHPSPLFIVTAVRGEKHGNELNTEELCCRFLSVNTDDPEHLI